MATFKTSINKYIALIISILTNKQRIRTIPFISNTYQYACLSTVLTACTHLKNRNEQG